MQWISDFLYQLITLFLFVVSLALMFYFLSEKHQTRFLIFLFASWTLAGAAICLYLNDRVLIEPETGGTLRPAREPNPPTPPGCEDVPDDAMRIYLGSSNLAWTAEPTCTIIRVAGDSLLEMEREKHGIVVNAKIFSDDKRITAELRNNKFYINPNNYFRRERPDKHTLVVYDQQNRAVLRLRFLNPLAVKLTGLFYYPRRHPIIIGEDEMTLPMGNTMSGGCFAGGRTIINVD